MYAIRSYYGALIEARSCERFTRLLETIGDRDAELAALLSDLGPAEERHWRMFYGLARITSYNVCYTKLLRATCSGGSPGRRQRTISP